jgi:hypothetical protein
MPIEIHDWIRRFSEPGADTASRMEEELPEPITKEA